MSRRKKQPSYREFVNNQLRRLYAELDKTPVGSVEYFNLLDQIDRINAQADAMKQYNTRVHPGIKKSLVAGGVMAALMTVNHLLDSHGEALSAKAQRMGESIANAGLRVFSHFNLDL